MIVVELPACAVPVSVVTLEAVIVIFPDVALGVIVNVGSCVSISNAYSGTKSKAISDAVHVASVPPRTILVGGKSSWVMIKVSALCTQFISGKIAAVKEDTAKKLLPLPLILAIRARFLKTYILPGVKTSI